MAIPDQAHAAGPLDRKVAVVTGGGGGLGRAMCLALTAAGATVLAVDVARDGLRSLEQESGGRVIGHHVDVSDDAQLAALVKSCVADHGRLDVVVNNAGIGQASLSGGNGDPVKFWDVDPDVLRRFFAVHALAGFVLAREAVSHMRERGWGRIVTVTTNLNTMIRGGRVPYGPAKAASEALTSVMSHDLDGTGVTANVLIPGGAARTPMVSRRSLESGRELLAPEIMGDPIVWLASDASDGVTGRRFLARLWDGDLSPTDAAIASSAPIAWARSAT